MKHLYTGIVVGAIAFIAINLIIFVWQWMVDTLGRMESASVVGISIAIGIIIVVLDYATEKKEKKP